MKLIEAQFLMFLARANRQHAEIVSGAYKFRQTQKATENGGWRDLTDDEKLKDALATMDRHLNFAQECRDFIKD